MAEANSIPLWAVWVPVVSAAVGGGIAVVGNIINNKINKKAEEKRQLREAVIKTALEAWRDHSDHARNRGGAVLPIDSYIVHMAVMSEALLNPEEFTEEEILKKLKQSDKLIDIQVKYDEERKKGSGSNA